jgi:hypothetical protein
MATVGDDIVISGSGATIISSIVYPVVKKVRARRRRWNLMLAWFEGQHGSEISDPVPSAPGQLTEIRDAVGSLQKDVQKSLVAQADLTDILRAHGKRLGSLEASDGTLKKIADKLGVE